MRSLGAAEARAVRVEVGTAGGPEAAARAARYAALGAGRGGRRRGRRTAGAHPRRPGRDRAARAGPRVRGPVARRDGPGVAGPYRRPLLGLPRADTVAACRAEGLAPWDDPHNDDPAFARVRVRREVLPVLEQELGPGVAEALARTARLLRDDADALDALAEEARAAAADGDGLRVDVLLAAPAAVRRRVLRRAALAAGCPATELFAGARRGGRRAAHRLARAGGRGPARPPARTSRRGQTAVLPGACGRLTSMDEKHVEGDLVNILYTEEQIQNRLAELAAAIERDYEGKEILLVGVLKGAVMVMADLARHFGRHVEMDWMAISSYGSGTKSSGVVRILKDLDTDINGRHVLVVEDIIDTGLTLSWLVSNLASRGPASVEICTLLRKPEAQQMSVDVKYVGYDIPNEFVVGYGLDYNEKYRNLRSIGTLAPHVYS